MSVQSLMSGILEITPDKRRFRHLDDKADIWNRETVRRLVDSTDPLPIRRGLATAPDPGVN